MTCGDPRPQPHDITRSTSIACVDTNLRATSQRRNTGSAIQECQGDGTSGPCGHGATRPGDKELERPSGDHRLVITMRRTTG